MPTRSDIDAQRRPHPVRKAEFARRAGRGRSTITEACRDGGPLRGAVLDRGHIDASHPAVAAWATERGIDPEALLDTGAPQRAPRPPKPPATPDIEAEAAKLPTGIPDLRWPQNPEDIGSFTLNQIIHLWGSLDVLADATDVRKKLADARRLEIGNRTKDGTLIERELVRTHMFGALDGFSRRLLGDAPKTIARRVYNLARTEAPLEDAEAQIRDAISSQLQVVKTQVQRALREEIHEARKREGEAA